MVFSCRLEPEQVNSCTLFMQNSRNIMESKSTTIKNCKRKTSK